MKKFQDTTRNGFKYEIWKEANGFLWGRVLACDHPLFTWKAVRWNLDGTHTGQDGYSLRSPEPEKITKTVYLYQFGHETMVYQSVVLAGPHWKLLGSAEVTFEIPNE